MKNMFCNELEKIENFEKAKAENFKGWNIHHKLETHNSEGKKRRVDITPEELKALGMYFERPAEELIYLTIAEHTRIHHKGKARTEERKNKISNTLKGHSVSEQTRNKISQKLKGRPLSEETKIKISLSTKGGNKTSFKKGHKNSKQAIEKQKATSKKKMAIKLELFKKYKDKMTWNEFQKYYKARGGNII